MADILAKKRNKNKKLTVLLTVGPTRAYIDRVRYVSNFSSGELGFHLAKFLLLNKAELVVIAGPTAQPFNQLRLKKLIEVETAEEMKRETLKACRSYRPHVAIFSAAVLDFRPKKIFKGKVSSAKRIWNIQMVPNPKIIDAVEEKFPEIKKIGFKLEWNQRSGKTLDSFAEHLIKEKNLFAICINFLPQIKRAQHPIWFYSKEGVKKFMRTKKKAARFLADFVIQQGVLPLDLKP